MKDQGVTQAERDFIDRVIADYSGRDEVGEVIAEDNEARKVRTIGEQVKRVPRLSDDPAVRLAECRGEAVAFDEEAERAKFIRYFKLDGKIYFDSSTRQWLPTRDSIEGFQMAERVLEVWTGWRASAKSRAGVV